MKSCKYLLIIFFLIYSSLVSAGEYHAFLIGVDNYHDSMIKGPGTAANDAKGLGEVLNKKYGFKTKVYSGEKATKKNILNKLDNYSKTLSKKDTLFIYFSGKTEYDAFSNDSWWIPYDAFYGDTLSYIDYSKASEILKKIKSNTLIATNSSLPQNYPSYRYGNSYSDSGLGIKLILNSSGNQSASSISPEFSIFGYSLIQALKDSDTKEVSVRSLSETASKNSSAQGLKLELKVLGISPVQKGEIKFANFSYKNQKDQVPLKKEKIKSQEKKPSVINIFTNPGEASLFIDNKFKGKTPVENLILQPGSYNLKLSKKGYKEKIENLKIDENRDKKLEFFLDKLIPEKGSLSINLIPDTGSIKFKNKEIKYKNKIKLDPGKYELVLSSPFYLEKSIKVEILEGQNLEIDEKLSPLMNFTNSISQKFVRITKGEFQMGTPDNELRRDPDENIFEVKISKDFFIMEKEVSLGDWKKFIEETNYKTDSEKEGGALVWIGYKWDKSWKYSWKNPGFDQTDKEPVTCVSYNDAAEFAKWVSQKENLNYSLPTEAQWEYSCRGGSQSTFAYGNCLLDTQANFAANSKRGNCPEGKNRNRTIETGKLLPNKFGLYDIHGNVMEWCLDFYSEYPKGKVVNPSGPATGKFKVVRGCGWETDINNCRAGNRFTEKQNTSKNNLGFRLVLHP
ncbi:MAG: SUMF1/EgtB/PvdO family nonheme iron enzyme [Desulforegulaceae bacterium]|nr:SUMF1/EgtB/PvdO family nonheme iron enzyme [Desulforegulaceae bacterium]